MLTDDELRQIKPNCPAAKRADYLPFIQKAMQEFEITSYLRETAFLAQLAHESAELRFMEEMSYAEIAKTVGQSEAALRGKVFRSLKLLRDALEKPATQKGVAYAM